MTEEAAWFAYLSIKHIMLVYLDQNLKLALWNRLDKTRDLLSTLFLVSIWSFSREFC